MEGVIMFEIHSIAQYDVNLCKKQNKSLKQHLYQTQFDNKEFLKDIIIQQFIHLQKSYQRKCNEYIIQQLQEQKEQEDEDNIDLDEQIIAEYMINIQLDKNKNFQNFYINTESYLQEKNDIIPDQVIFPYSFEFLYNEKDLQEQAYQEDKPFFFQHSKVDHFRLDDFQKFQIIYNKENIHDFTVLSSFWQQNQQPIHQKSSMSTKSNSSSNISTNNILNMYKTDKVFDITDSYYRENYYKIALLGGGSFGKVELYYEKQLNKMMAIKTFTKKQKVKNKQGQYEEKKFDLELCQEELENILKGLQTQEFPDQQIIDRRRNIEREIKLAHGLSKDNNPYISKFVGLILIHTDEELSNKSAQQKLSSNNSLSYIQENTNNNNSLNNIQSSQNVTTQGNLSQKNLEDIEDNLSQKSNLTNDFGSPQKKKTGASKMNKNVQKIEEEQDENQIQFKNKNISSINYQEEAKKYKTVKLVFEYFGCYGYNSSQKKIFTPDLRSYIKRNAKNQSLFYNTRQKQQFIDKILQQLLQSFYYLHEKQNVYLRDFKDDNIIVKRIYDPLNPEKSIHSIRICDFGLAKQFPLEELEQEQLQKIEEQKLQEQKNLEKLQKKNNQNDDDDDDDEENSSYDTSSYSSSYSFNQEQDEKEDQEEEYSSDDIYGWKAMPKERQVSVTKYKNFRNLYTHPKLMIEKYLNSNNALIYDKKDDIYSLGIVIIKLHEVLKLNFDKNDAPIIQDLTGFQFKEILRFYKNRNYQKDNGKDKVYMVKVLKELLEFRDRKQFKERKGKWRSKYIYKSWQKIHPIENIIEIYGQQQQNN